MIDKQAFVGYMQKIQDLVNHERAIDSALRDLDDNFGGFSMSPAITLAVELLQLLVEDDTDLLGYYIWETEFGTNSCADSLTENDKRIPFKTFDDVYDAIMNENKMSELEKYKKLYENEKDHSETLERILQRIGGQL